MTDRKAQAQGYPDSSHMENMPADERGHSVDMKSSAPEEDVNNPQVWSEGSLYDDQKLSLC